ncbi:hypothetical protein BH11MYX2_BH11MYX2_19510 [soil metagenome]
MRVLAFWMSRAFVTAVLFLVIACRSADPVPSPGAVRDPVTATPPAPTTDAPAATPLGWDGRGDFELIISEFHFETGTQIVHVDGQGHIEDVLAALREVNVKQFCSAAKTKSDRELCAQVKGEKTFMNKFWRRAKYDATAPDLDDLRRRLVAASFAQLDKKYTGDNGDDGVTTMYHLIAAGTDYTVSSYGTSTRGEPPKLLEVFKWMRVQQDAHEALRKDAPTLADADYAVQARAWNITQ